MAVCGAWSCMALTQLLIEDFVQEVFGDTAPSYTPTHPNLSITKMRAVATLALVNVAPLSENVVNKAGSRT